MKWNQKAKINVNNLQERQNQTQNGFWGKTFLIKNVIENKIILVGYVKWSLRKKENKKKEKKKEQALETLP